MFFFITSTNIYIYIYKYIILNKLHDFEEYELESSGVLRGTPPKILSIHFENSKLDFVSKYIN